MPGSERLDPRTPTPERPATGEFRSVLFVDDPPDLSATTEPPCFRDLNLDQTVEAIVAGRDEYLLKPYFHSPLRDPETVVYRHEVFRELEASRVRDPVQAFAAEIRRTRQSLTLVEKQYFAREKQRWFLDAAGIYCGAVSTLSDALSDLPLSSRGFSGLRDYLASYLASERFSLLRADQSRVLAGLDEVRYTVRIHGARVTVSRYQGERDYSVEVAETFARFREREAGSHLVKLPDPGSMDHVEAQIAELVARLYPATFADLDEFCAHHRGFIDPRIQAVDRELQFCLAYLEHMERLSRSGLSFCYPTVSATSKETSVEDAFDIALAAKLTFEGAAPVSNDLALSGPERILVVTGPNQGGKTTFARMFGQLHHLASLGVPVPGQSARLFLPDRIFTHFERQEDIATLRGKLDDELVRMRDILEEATADSLVVINEIFASTTLADAVQLGEKVLRQILERDCLAVCVTFVDELTTLDQGTISMVATVPAADPAKRTFKIVRKPADGRAYAVAIVNKYGLTYERLRARIAG
jgi:DNA mismatch repair protein MutS